MGKEKKRILGKQVWCQTCVNKRPPHIERADFLIPLRKKPYDLCSDGLGIDQRVFGICVVCLDGKSKFQQGNKAPVDINHGHLVYKEV